jgi:hypothetical protein
MRKLFVCVIAILLAIPCSASDIKTQKNILYPPQSSVIIQEEFVSGTTTNGFIGRYGWVGVGSVIGIASIANRPGIYQLSTTAASGTIGRFTIYIASAALLQSTIPHDVLWIARLNTNDANTTTRIGGADSVSTNPPTSGIYFEKLDGDTNWFCVTRVAGVETRTDSTVVIDTNFNTFYYRRASAGVEFKINNVNVCTHTTNLITAAYVPFVQIVNSAAAAKTIDMDYFEMKYTGITR